jgi:predicted O-methyltransferase YrrM
MNNYEKLIEIKKFSDKVGHYYGTEDFSIYLYSIIKMMKPKTVLELGTGLGISTLWAAIALEENKNGTIHTIDDGSDWSNFKVQKFFFENYYRDSYHEYISNLISTFQFNDVIHFHHEKINEASEFDNLDIIFSDYSHSPYSVINLIAKFLPKMKEDSYIFIDSASTYYSSFHTLEAIVDNFNRGKIPKTLFELISPDDLEKFYSKVMNSKFELTHIIENKNRNQNSTAQIKISPIDIMPSPRINIRF